MARSTPAFLQSARITALAACEDIRPQLHSSLHTHYLLLLPGRERASPNIAFPKAAAAALCSSAAPAITQHTASCQALPKHTQVVPAHHSIALLCAVPSPSLLTCTGGVKGAASPGLSQREKGEKEKNIYRYF